jgi:hypothetical protein
MTPRNFALKNFEVLRQNALLEIQPLEPPGGPDAVSHFDGLLVVVGKQYEIALPGKTIDARDHRPEHEQGYNKNCYENYHAKSLFPA